jgi:hypothetical protein
MHSAGNRFSLTSFANFASFKPNFIIRKGLLGARHPVKGWGDAARKARRKRQESDHVGF